MKTIAEKVLALGQSKADYFEVRAESRKYSVNFMKNGTLTASTQGEDRGLAIRAIVGGGMGAAYTNRTDEASLEKAVGAAVEQAKKVSGTSNVRLSDEKTYKDYWTVEQKRKIEDVDNDEKVERLKEIEQALTSSKIPAVVRMQVLRDMLTEKHILTSEGTDISSLLPQIEYFYFMVVASEKGNEQAYSQLAWAGGYDQWDKWNPLGRTTDMA